jgi:hypothetical protein
VHALTIILVLAGFPSFVGPVAVQQGPLPSTDLDAFMERVLARRDENWRKLQQYVLDERERAEVLGPGRARLYGLEREYTWYIRDGAFVRSPVRFDGVTLSEDQRRKYEQEWLQREQAREARAAKAETPGVAASPPEQTDVDALVRLTREPQFVSTAYFLKFNFEQGRYAFAGREQYDGREVLRIEYYPTRLIAIDKQADEQGEDDDDEKEKLARRIERQMNKVALVTLWVEPSTHQIVKYTFENVGMDFLPGRWFVRVEGAQVSMQMGEPFPGVWLPKGILAHVEIALATGAYEVRYDLRYENYREAEVKARLR